MWDTIAKLWIQTSIETTLQYVILCVLTLVNQKLQVVCGCSTYRMTALLLEMYIFHVRAGCEIWMVSYASKYASQSLSDKQSYAYSVLRRITWKLQVILGYSGYQTTAILSETFFVLFRFAIEIQLESYDPRHALVVLWYDIVCMYCKPAYISLFDTQLCLTTNLTYMYLITAYYTPNDGFTANDALFLLWIN